jgi:hypothetical protein
MDDRRRRLANFTYPARFYTVFFCVRCRSCGKLQGIVRSRTRMHGIRKESDQIVYAGAQSRFNRLEQQRIAIAFKENTVPDNYTEQLAERLRAQKTPGRSLNKAAFLAVKADVVAALEAGFVSKVIWSDLRTCKRIDFSYDTFLRLVKIYISSAPAVRTHVTFTSKKSTVKDKPANWPAAASSQPVDSTSEKTSFVYNPVPNRDELL